MNDFSGKRVTVAGLGKFGGQIAAAKWLAAQGAKVLVTDRSPADKLASSIKELEGLPIDFRLGEHKVEDFTQADLVVTSPAIPPHNLYLAAARSAGVPITTEIRLFIERCPARIVGITGTKGKSTTTALLGRMLATKFTTHVGGNIGKPLLLDLPRIAKDDIVVLELSSFMLEYLRDMTPPWSPHVAVMTMLSADHIDWHGSAEAYLDAKKQILKHQKPGDVAVLAEGMAHTADLAAITPARVVLFSMKDPPFELKIPGRHNQFNCQAAWRAAESLGVDFETAQRAVIDFPGLPHRLQLVHESLVVGGIAGSVAGAAGSIADAVAASVTSTSTSGIASGAAAGTVGGAALGAPGNTVRWFNDSIATIPDAAVAALESFPPRTVLHIVGGSDKGLPFTSLAAALCERSKAALCIGTTGPIIASLIADSPTHQCAPVYQCGDLATAVAQAKLIAAPGDVVLLSTGCASYDQFANFEQRGEQFAALARESG